MERMQKVWLESFINDEMLLISSRCKQLALHLQILLEIWQQHKKLLEHQKRDVHNNEEALISKAHKSKKSKPRRP